MGGVGRGLRAGRAAAGLVAGITLTAAGRVSALAVVRRHRLLEMFLVTELDLAWDEVHEEAEALEHAVSDRLLDRIDTRLGHPRFDPHGDPISRTDVNASGEQYCSGRNRSPATLRAAIPWR